MPKGEKIEKESESTNLPGTNSPFWVFVLLTLPGVIGLISFLSDGPGWLTISGFVIDIYVFIWWSTRTNKSNSK